MTWLHGNSVRVPSFVWPVTDTAFPFSVRMPTTRVFITTVHPLASTRSRARSHIIPGPCFGYWNSSISDVIDFWFRFGRSEFITALYSDRFLIRCAAKSAGSLLTGTPQSFSLYVLKKCRYNRQPKRDTIHPSSVDWSFGGFTRAHVYDITHNAASQNPRFLSAFIALSG